VAFFLLFTFYSCAFLECSKAEAGNITRRQVSRGAVGVIVTAGPKGTHVLRKEGYHYPSANAPKIKLRSTGPAVPGKKSKNRKLSAKRVSDRNAIYQRNFGGRCFYAGWLILTGEPSLETAYDRFQSVICSGLF
jgi:hypothetical protein